MGAVLIQNRNTSCLLWEVESMKLSRAEDDVFNFSASSKFFFSQSFLRLFTHELEWLKCLERLTLIWNFSTLLSTWGRGRLPRAVPSRQGSTRESWPPGTWIRIFILIRFPGGLCANQSLRSTLLCPSLVSQEPNGPRMVPVLWIEQHHCWVFNVSIYLFYFFLY